MNNATESLKLKYSGVPNQIEINTLINSLLHFSAISHEVNRELETNKKIEIKINAVAPGSFLIHIEIVSTLLTNIFTADNTKIAVSIISVIGGLYKLVKFLKGKEAKILESNDNSTKIENNKGEITYIDNRTLNIYKNNTIIRENIAQEFETLEADTNIDGFAILDEKDNSIVNIEKEEFSEIVSMNDNIISTDERIVPKTGILSILKLSFETNLKWEFYYEGNKITGKIKDDEFIKLIDEGEKFAKGDTLLADIDIKQEFDKSVNTYINKSYTITKINSHIRKDEQKKLDFPKK